MGAGHSGFLEILGLIAWVVLVSLVALSSRIILNDWPLLLCLGIALVVASGMWARKQPWITEYKRPLDRQLAIVFSAIFASVVVYVIAFMSGLQLEKLGYPDYPVDA